MLIEITHCDGLNDFKKKTEDLPFLEKRFIKLVLFIF